MTKLYSYLSYAGSTVFIVLSFCLLINIREIPWLGPVEEILRAYTFMILVFLTGSHWGQHLKLEGKWHRCLPLLSNVMAVMLCVLFLTFSVEALFVIYMISFAFLLLVDKRLCEASVITKHYFQMRCIVTAIAIVSILFAEIVL